MDALQQSLAFIEHLEQLTRDWDDYIGTLPVRTQAEGTALNGRLKALIEAMDVEAQPLNIAGDTHVSLPRTKVDRLGVGGEVLRLHRDRNLSPDQIVQQLEVDISAGTVSRYIKMYESAKPSQQVKMRRNSIFEIPERLEDLAMIVQRQLARLEAVDDEVHVKYVSEMRQLIQLTSDMVKLIYNAKRFQEMVRINYEVLKDELPEKRALIDEKFKQLQQMLGLELTAT